MHVTTLHEVEEALRSLDPEDLHEMGYRMALSHKALCGVTSQIGGCGHIEDGDIRDRVDALDTVHLAELLAPMAWVSIDLGDHLES